MDSLDQNRQRWQQIYELFLAARKRSAQARSAFLDDACSATPDLRADVESLLVASEETPDDFLEAGDAGPAAALLGSLVGTVGQGDLIGPYRVVRELGRGGMGVVYLAERADGQFEQQVALKLIKRGMDSDAILSRFLHERQILARLQHPNVARLLDGGVTDGGQPFFAMEYVEGLPLTDYCDRGQLDIEARLRLFQAAARAVQYAHANLVVHRDLKPSNILVTKGGELKLLDFGIAKLLDDDGDVGPATLTRAGLRAMTPEYAAPEQILGEPVTTATDVYALGVVLYELLSGHRPFPSKAGAPETLARLVAGVAPERPSSRVGRAEQRRHTDGSRETITPEAVSLARATQPRRLRRRLSGDLDTVVLKALRQESSRRYASVEALLEDIEHHLAGLPVKARGDRFPYRAWTFVRRHAVGVAFATILVVLTIAAAVAMALQQAETARQASRAEEVKNFVLSLFAVSDPRKAPSGDAITARELLERGVARIDEELREQPEIQAEMLAVIGDIYSELGRYDQARPLLERALAVRREVLGSDHIDVASTLDLLATLLLEQGDFAAAEPLSREALAIRRRQLGSDHLDTSISTNNLGILMRRMGNYAEAESLYRESLAVKRKRLGEEHPDTLSSLNNLAVLLHTKGDYNGAESLHRNVLTIRRRALGEHPQVALSLNNLGWILRDKGDYAAAEPYYRESVAMWRKLLGDEHPNLALALMNLGRVLRDQGDHDAAEPLVRRALAMNRKLLGSEHQRVALALNNLGLVLRDQGSYAEAEAAHREALAISQRLVGVEHPTIASALHNLGLALQAQGDYASAEPYHRQALAMQRKLLGEEHPYVASSLVALAQALVSLGAPGEGEPLLRQGLAIRDKALPEAHWRRAEVRNLLGACLSALRRYEEAEPLLVAGYTGLRETRGENHSVTTLARQNLVAHYERLGLPGEAAVYRLPTDRIPSQLR